jgi:hypothetical protein
LVTDEAIGGAVVRQPQVEASWLAAESTARLSLGQREALYSLQAAPFFDLDTSMFLLSARSPEFFSQPAAKFNICAEVRMINRSAPSALRRWRHTLLARGAT